MSAKAIKELSERIEQLDSKVKQLYQQTYSPPTNNDLYKILSDLVDKMNTALGSCLLYTSPSPRDRQKSRMPSSA